MATTGQVKEFNPDSDNISAYVERVNIFFTVNNIAADKRAAVFLNFLGGQAYELLRNLLSPALPQTPKYDELVEHLKEYNYEPKPLPIAERFHFHRRNQKEGESIAEYMAELQRLSTHCEFKAYLNEALRDRLVCGICSESMQRRLLAERDLSLQKAIELAQGMEAADRNVKSLKGLETAVNKLQLHRNYSKHKSQTSTAAATPTPATPCHRCGQSNHDQRNCRFREAECHLCHKKGHIAPACRAKNNPN